MKSRENEMKRDLYFLWGTESTQTSEFIIHLYLYPSGTQLFIIYSTYIYIFIPHRDMNTYQITKLANCTMIMAINLP